MTLLANDTFFEFNKLLRGAYAAKPKAYRWAHTPTQTAIASKENNAALCPKTDIIKLNEGYQLITELPGISKEQISVTLNESVLTIETIAVDSNRPEKTDTACENENSSIEFLRKERHDGKFKRSFDLGQNIELSAITAQSKDGLLTLTIPLQKEEPVVPRTINIH